jgi:hypothetical protein
MKFITTEERLLTPAWAQDARVVATAVRGLAAARPLKSGCRVVLFEVTGDRELHVNVTHEHPTVTARGWSGPGVTADGFVHNRRFMTEDSGRIVRSISDMVFARRLAVSPARRQGVSA